MRASGGLPSWTLYLGKDKVMDERVGAPGRVGIRRGVGGGERLGGQMFEEGGGSEGRERA